MSLNQGDGPTEQAYQRVRARLGVALALGGEAEVAYPRAC